MLNPDMEFSREILESGIAPGERGSSLEGREPIKELHEDIEVYLMLISFARERMAEALDEMEKRGGREELKKALEKTLDELNIFERKFFSVGSQAELFSTQEVAQGNEESVKLLQFKKLRDEFREWWNISTGIKNIFSHVTHEFGDIRDFRKLIFTPNERERTQQWYGRGFNKEISRREQELAKALNVPEVALFNSGMSAIETVLESEGLKDGDAIVAAENFYIQTSFLLDALKNRGVRVVRVKSSDLEALKSAISSNNPRLIFSEVISNAPTMEVFPVRELLEFLNEHNESREANQRARILLDNTFLTPKLLPVLEIVDSIPDHDYVKLAVVESATKHYQYGLDNVTAGLVYSDDDDYMKELKRKRGTIGTHLQEQTVSYIPPADAEALEQKMLRHSSNARLLSEALRDVPNVKVSNPEGLSGGSGGLFYIEWDHPSISAEEAVNSVYQLAQSRGVDIRMGVSFGHPQTWLETIRLSDEKTTVPQTIRISVGEENVADFKKVIEVFREALTKT